jgi:hypothetical protein
MGHISIDTIHHMNSNNTSLGFKLDKNSNLKEPCEGCMLGKKHKSSYPIHLTKERTTISGQFIHGNGSGKISIPSIWGSLYYILYSDDCSTYRFVHFARKKSEAFKFFQHLVKIIKRNTGNDVQKIWTNKGTKFCNQAFDKFLADIAITWKTSTPYTPQQNGYIERNSRTVMESVRNMIYAKDMPKHLWAEAVNTTVYLLNRTANKQLGSLIPYKRYYGTKPDVRQQGSFFRLHVARKHPKKISCCKRYKNLRKFLDEKAKCRPWIIKKKPKLDDNRIIIGKNLFYIHNIDECRNILLHYNILYSQLSFTANMKKRTLFDTTRILDHDPMSLWTRRYNRNWIRRAYLPILLAIVLPARPIGSGNLLRTE